MTIRMSSYAFDMVRAFFARADVGDIHATIPCNNCELTLNRTFDGVYWMLISNNEGLLIQCWDIGLTFDSFGNEWYFSDNVDGIIDSIEIV